MVKCLTCGGVYEPLQPDGTQYFHACPPLAAHEIAAGLNTGAIVLSGPADRRYRAALNADTANPPAPGEPSRAERVLTELRIERPNMRDENVVAFEDDKGPRSRMKAEGAGVVNVPPDR